MNLHVPQGMGGITELETFMSVTAHILTAQNNAPIIGIIQDGLIGSYVITSSSTMIPKHVAFDCITSLKLDVDINDFAKRISQHYPDTVKIIKNKKKTSYILADLIPGKALYSVLFPEDFFYKKKTETNPQYPKVKISKGVLLPDSGPLCKKVLGQKANSIIHYLYLEHSPEICRDFITNVQFLVNRCFATLGFSVGISDCLSNVPYKISCTTKDDKAIKVLSVLKKKLEPAASFDKPAPGQSMLVPFDISNEKTVRDFIDRYSLEKVVNITRESVMKDIREVMRKTMIECDELQSQATSKQDAAMIEKETNALLNSMTNFGLELSQKGLSGGTKNRLAMMTNSGAKGSYINCTAIIAFVSQQNVKGRRIPRLLTGGERSSTHRLPGDNSPAARGSINRPYFLGLTPEQAYFHAMGGREGLIDTAIKTANSGYAERRLVKRMEDLKLHYDNTVRYNDGTIVQYMYGYDLFDPSRLYYVDGKLFFIDPSRLAKRLNLKSEETAIALSTKKINEVCSILEFQEFPKFRSNVVLKADENIQNMMRTFLKSVMLAPDLFDEFKKRIERSFHKALAQPGDMVGIIAACSIGEPATQGTLNSVDWLEKISISQREAPVRVCHIGEFIDDIIDRSYSVLYSTENETEYVDVRDLKYYVPTVDERGNVTWGLIEAVTRHLPGGKLLKVTTNGGRTVTATKSKSFLVRRVCKSSGKHSHKQTKIVPVRGDELQIGDFVPVIANHPVIRHPLHKLSGIELTRDAGFFFGMCMAHGFKDDEDFIDIRCSGATREKLETYALKENDAKCYFYPEEEYEPASLRIISKTILHALKLVSRDIRWTISACDEFVKGFLDGYLSAGAVFLHGRTPVFNIMLNSPDYITINGFSTVACLLARFGIHCVFNQDNNFYRLGISDEDVLRVIDKIGLTRDMTNFKVTTKSHSKVLNDIVFEKIESIEEVNSSTDRVYDLTVEGTRNFALENLLCVRDTFHAAGMSGKDVTLGAARLQECLDATKKPKTPSCLIYLNDEILEQLHQRVKEAANDNEKDDARTKCLERVQKLQSSIQYTTIKTLLSKDPVIKRVARDQPQQSPVDLTPYEDYDEDVWWLKMHESLFGSLNIEPSQWVVELHFDLDRLFEYDITLDTIADLIESLANVGKFSCVVSPLILGQIHVYTSFDAAFIDGADLHTPNKTKLITLENVDFFYARDVVCKGISEARISGIRGISRVFPKEIKSEWVIDTQGCNFREILNHPLCDYTKTICDEFWQTYEVLGIEAARETLLIELNKCLSFDGTYINPKNAEQLVDSMTYTGRLTNTRREGIGKVAGPLAACAFEKTMDNFASAAIMCENEDVSGVSASITMGKLSKIGTGFCAVFPDPRVLASEKRPKLNSAIGDVVERY